MVGANVMASLAAPEVNPDRCPAGPTGRPSVDGAPHACPRTDMHGAYYYAAIAHSLRIVSFMRVRVVSFMRLPADVPCIDSAQPAAT